MFDRIVRLAQARKALQDGHFEEALRLVDDPIVRSHRKADVLRGKAVDGLVARAASRAELGVLSAAMHDCDRALGVRPEHDRARELRDELRRRAEDTDGRAESARALCRDAVRALDSGDAGDAERLIDLAAGVDDSADVQALRARVRSQRERARELFVAASAARKAGQLDDAVDLLSQARAIDVALPGADREAAELASRLAPVLREQIDAAFASGGASAAREVWGRSIARLPEVASQGAVRDALRRAERDDRRVLVDLLERGDLQGAVECARGSGPKPVDGFGAVVDQLGRAVELAARGEFRDAAELAAEVGEELGIAGIERRAREWSEAADRNDERLHRARTASSEGRLNDARMALLEIATQHPGHAAARREMELLDQGSEDRARRMTDARALARDGRLREAAAVVVTLSVPGAEGEEARLLLRDLQQRMDTVAAGIRQVLRAMHGRDSATREGLVHCAGRLDELEKVQQDSVELAQLRTATAAEIEGLELLDAARRALRSSDAVALRAAFQALTVGRARLLAPDRLDARLLAIVDEIFVEAESCVSAARPARAERLIDAARGWLGTQGDTTRRLTELDARIGERRVRAAHHLAVAQEAIAARDPERAEAALETARESAADDSSVGRLEAELAELRRRDERLQEVENMAGRRDFDGAHRALDRLGPTPSLMRTRIYDLKRTLAEAQGLQGAFLLRVDEGGEFLVVRGESLTIGNLRDGTSDLPMLASLAGRHARLRRTLSFHGGQEDRIEAEGGSVSIGGRQVDSLRLESGQRVRLGDAVELIYRLPSERSLTSVLSIRGGFQIAGTDTVLWMKDRGRDGRILIGPTSDCHVQVASATAVVEVFAGRDGQVRVHSPSGGEIDRKPFQDEHPIAAGSSISCAGTSFVLQPWSRTS